MQSNEFISIKNNKKFWDLVHRSQPLDIYALRLKHPNISVATATAIFELKKVYEKLPKKMPVWSKFDVIMPLKAFQQCSTERVSKFKSGLFQGAILIDLTGGIGMDDWAFSFCFEKIISFDTDPIIHECAVHNLNALGVTNIERRCQDGTKNIESLPYSDLIYIDPDRRSQTVKGVALSDMTPNLEVCIPELWNKTDRILLKLSPLFDIKMIVNLWPETAHIWVIAEKNDVKEVSVLLDKTHKGHPKISAINLDDETFNYTNLVNATEKTNIDVTFEIQKNDSVVFPYHSLTKSGLSDHYFSELGCEKISNTQFYISQKSKRISGGTDYKIQEILKADTKSIKNYFAKNPNFQASLMTKGLKINTNEFKKKIALNEGGRNILLLLKSKKGVKALVLTPL